MGENNNDLTHWGLNKMADNLQTTFLQTFSNEFSLIISILIQNSLKFVPEGPTDNKSSLVQVMAWSQRGIMPSLKPMVTHITNTMSFV